MGHISNTNSSESSIIRVPKVCNHRHYIFNRKLSLSAVGSQHICHGLKDGYTLQIFNSCVKTPILPMVPDLLNTYTIPLKGPLQAKECMHYPKIGIC
jgi:hypothetical protein